LNYQLLKLILIEDIHFESPALPIKLQ